VNLDDVLVETGATGVFDALFTGRAGFICG